MARIIVVTSGKGGVGKTVAAAFLARQAWGALADRIGGLRTVLAGSVCQMVAIASFLLTQDEAGLFAVAAICYLRHLNGQKRRRDSTTGTGTTTGEGTATLSRQFFLRLSSSATLQ